MKKILIFITLGLTYLNADVMSYTYAKSFFENGGKNTEQMQKFLENDKDYIEANEFLDNTQLQDTRDITIGDPEKPESLKKEKKNFPNWNKAMPLLIKSAKTNNNPVSAYEAIYAYETLYGINRNVVDFGEMSKILYNNEKELCQSYLYYAMSLIKGYGFTVNKKEANKVLQESQKIERCKKGWISNVLASYMLQTKTK